MGSPLGTRTVARIRRKQLDPSRFTHVRIGERNGTARFHASGGLKIVLSMSAVEVRTSTLQIDAHRRDRTPDSP
jgi:hypothetical protein